MEKETLEEAAERLIFKTIGGNYGIMSSDENDQVDGYYNTYEEAYLRLKLKWQAERMYSEEEVRELLIRALTHNDYNFCGALVTAQHEIRTANFGVWFEHFKKK